MVISSADIRKMVSESVQRVLESSIVDDVEKNFEKEVVRVCEDINNYLSKFGIRAKFNKKYDFSGYYSDSVGVYQRRSVTRNGCMRFSVNINALKAFAEEDEDIITYDDNKVITTDLTATHKDLPKDVVVLELKANEKAYYKAKEAINQNNND